jgi:Tfp pilus assembly protein PilW
MKKAVTLTELIVAILLMSAIVLGAVAFDLASRRLFVSTERDTVLLNELALVLDHLDRNIKFAEGDANNPGIVWDAANSQLSIIRVNDAILNGTAQIADDDIGDYDSDSYTTVVYDFSGGQIRYQGNLLTPHLAAVPTVTVGCTGAPIAGCQPAGSCRCTAARGGVRMDGLSLTDGNFTVSMLDLRDGADDTIFFYPISHSWN